MIRLILGFISAAFVVPVSLYFASGTYRAFWLFMVASFIVPLTLFVAAPLYYLARKRITFWLCIFCGGLVGILGSLVFLLSTNKLAAQNWVLSFVFIGLFSSAIFWFVGIWRNYSLTHPSRGTGESNLR